MKIVQNNCFVFVLYQITIQNICIELVIFCNTHFIIMRNVNSSFLFNDDIFLYDNGVIEYS